MDKDLQVENGNFTRIVNKVIDELVKVSLLGTELSICLFVIRKTYGYGKKEDQISLSQFEQGIKRSRPTIAKALKNLQLLNILKLVKVGSSKKASSIWSFNKYYTQWHTPVNTPQLVKDRTPTSKAKLSQLVKTPKHTKDNTKETIQKKEENTPSKNAKLFFKGVKDLIEKVNSVEANATRVFLRELETKYSGVEKGFIWAEIKKFYLYWTELNQSGTKERWQKQEAFQVDRRLVTWFGKIEQFKRSEIRNKETKVGKL